jgi:hypothetical protein
MSSSSRFHIKLLSHQTENQEETFFILNKTDYWLNNSDSLFSVQ